MNVSQWWSALGASSEWIGLGLIAVAATVLVRRRARATAGKVPVTSGATSSPARRQGDSATLIADHLLDRVQRLGSTIEVGALLQQIAELVGSEFGFERVLVRVFNPRTHLHEARAFWGFEPADIARLSTLDVSADEYDAMTHRAAPVQGGWRVDPADHAWPDRLDASAAATWAAGGDHLVLPLPDDHDAALGYVCVLPRRGVECCGEPVLVPLQVVIRIAAAELRRARLGATLQRRELEYSIVSEQLREWQGTRDNFMANVSHELRTPLTSVKAYAETLALGLDSMDHATAVEFLGVIQHETERLEQVFDDLLDVAQLEGRGRRVARDRLDLRATVRDLCRSWRPRFEEHGLRLRVFGADEELWIQGDGDGIRQVVEALLSNALKFTPAGGRVAVHVQEDAGTAQIAVEDTGIGVPDRERLRIFERFYQVDSSATRPFGGQGLGLALCREIVGWHHGRIWVEDAHPQGSRFVVSLPVRGLVVRQRVDDPSADAAERAQWEAFLQLTIHLVSELAGTRIASIMLVDEAHEVLRIEAAVGLEEEVVQNTRIARGEAVAGAVWRDDVSILVPDLDADEQFCHLADDLTYRPRSLLSVPLRWGGRLVGVLNVNTKLDGTPFDDDDRLLLEALSDRIMLALDSFERYRIGYRRLAAVESGVRAMLDVGRERRTRLREEFARLGVETGRRLGLDEDHLRALSYALRTYDVGLTQISTQILHKTTPLALAERERIEDHSRLGAELVAEIEPSPRVRKMILHHHENFDGTGYPSGLVGEAIPVGARIVRLADTFAALLHDRPFRGALSLRQAEQMLREGVPQRFCPRVTPVFLAVVADRGRVLEALLEVAIPPESSEIGIESPAQTPAS